MGIRKKQANAQMRSGTSAKEKNNRMKKESMEWEKISKTYRELTQFSNKKNPTKNKTKTQIVQSRKKQRNQMFFQKKTK